MQYLQLKGNSNTEGTPHIPLFIAIIALSHCPYRQQDVGPCAGQGLRIIQGDNLDAESETFTDTAAVGNLSIKLHDTACQKTTTSEQSRLTSGSIF
jgi:hypothetical protein